MRWAVAVALGGAAFCAACGKAAEPAPERPSPTAEVAATAVVGSVEIVDMAGRMVLLPEEVQRVVALSPSAAEFAATLGLAVVGRSSDTPEADFPGAKAVGATISPDFNAVATLEPDLVLADAAYHAGRTRDFDRFAYPVYVLKADTFAGVLDALTALGKATGRDAAALQVRESLEATARGLAEQARGKPTVRVLLLTGGGRDVFAGSSQTYAGSLIELLGGVNVLGSAPDGGPIPGFGVVEVAQAASLNPDVVLILPSGQGGLLEQLKASAAWANSPAVRQGRVSNLDTALFLRSPGPSAGAALQKLFQLLWP